ncbi:hypothetical protein KIN20_005573 [Parelaphostrongylus tenuis]|uniref:Uncharacterized protein n=1 Tax=Parelaphostrongylus tenuis TaxID=148309 RepID=A0AAD5M3G5_PARTN|nr:hypothetical protein KIN20_005573 [Parelaphostrongylus tenuis]
MSEIRGSQFGPKTVVSPFCSPSPTPSTVQSIPHYFIFKEQVDTAADFMVELPLDKHLLWQPHNHEHHRWHKILRHWGHRSSPPTSPPNPTVIAVTQKPLGRRGGVKFLAGLPPRPLSFYDI